MRSARIDPPYRPATGPLASNPTRAAGAQPANPVPRRRIRPNGAWDRAVLSKSTQRSVNTSGLAAGGEAASVWGAIVGGADAPLPARPGPLPVADEAPGPHALPDLLPAQPQPLLRLGEAPPPMTLGRPRPVQPREVVVGQPHPDRVGRR